MPTLRKTRVSFVILALSLSCALLSTGAAAAQEELSPQTQASAQRLVQLMNECGYTYTQVAPNVWTIPSSGRTLGQFKVLVVAAEDTSLVGVVLVQMHGRPFSPELMRKLLDANHTYDYVKTFIDSDGDIGIRIERRVRILDAEEFRANVRQLSRASDEIYAEIQPLLGN